MPDYGHPILSGYFLIPTREPRELVHLAQVADLSGIDLLGIQDHPYHPDLLELWTLLSTLATVTARIRFFPDVASLALRPPAVLARSAATLDVLSGGRLELGVGAGGSTDAIASFGGPRRSLGEHVDALEEAITVLRRLLKDDAPVTLDGKHYQLQNAAPATPAHDIEIWVGAHKPRMLSVVGRQADGWLPPGKATPSDLVEMNKRIDEAAVAADRDPATIRRHYHVRGTFEPHGRSFLQGPSELWAEQLTELALSQGMSSFILISTGEPERQLRTFAAEVVPALKEGVARARRPPPAVGEQAMSIAAIDGPSPAGPELAADPTEIGRFLQRGLVEAHHMLEGEMEEIEEQVAALGNALEVAGRPISAPEEREGPPRGARLRSIGSTTEIVVIRSSRSAVRLTCAGSPMLAVDWRTTPTGVPVPRGVELACRYMDEQSGLEVLCTNPGRGPLAADGRTLRLRRRPQSPVNAQDDDTSGLCQY
jgi:alkanesulfonate monooxygenase SsuD/methylene tetrahydromethanopterin reductase-like flavin-dependent oxidoreductase (luciferase family)